MTFFSRTLAASTAAVIAGLMVAAPALALDGAVGEDPLELAQAAPALPTTDRGRTTFNPQSICLDHVARRAGGRTYLRIRLDLKPEQMTAWSAFTKAADDADVKETARCKALPTELKERPGYIERLTMREAAMKAQLDRIEAVKPSLAALYGTLSAEQKTVLDGARMMGGSMRGTMGPPSGPR
ncbi:MAG: hypothetical protein FJX11_02020 [Alphaproteobacteria bacterium]|nr:hypothetical protein [Alphaproteobacteria bacterium]